MSFEIYFLLAHIPTIWYCLRAHKQNTWNPTPVGFILCVTLESIEYKNVEITNFFKKNIFIATTELYHCRSYGVCIWWSEKVVKRQIEFETTYYNKISNVNVTAWKCLYFDSVAGNVIPRNFHFVRNYPILKTVEDWNLWKFHIFIIISMFFCWLRLFQTVKSLIFYILCEYI